jgi:hypothetical protein
MCGTNCNFGFLRYLVVNRSLICNHTSFGVDFKSPNALSKINVSRIIRLPHHPRRPALLS